MFERLDKQADAKYIENVIGMKYQEIEDINDEISA